MCGLLVFCGLLHLDSLWPDAVLVFLALTIGTNVIVVVVFISYRELDNQSNSNNSESTLEMREAILGKNIFRKEKMILDTEKKKKKAKNLQANSDV